MRKKELKYQIGSYCIHASKYEKTPCRIVCYDGDTVVIKRIGKGYVGVPEKSLTPISKEEAIRIAQQTHMNRIGASRK